MWESTSGGLIREAGEQWHSQGELSQDLLCCLHAVHGRSLLPALQLLDDKKVSRLRSPCGRWIYRVSGSSGVPYLCLPGSTYCQCPAYKYSVVLRHEAVMCKHCLAARLATEMGLLIDKTVTDQEMADVIASID